MILRDARAVSRATLITLILIVCCSGYQRTAYAISPTQAPKDHASHQMSDPKNQRESEKGSECSDDHKLLEQHHADGIQPAEQDQAQSQPGQEHQHQTQTPAKKPAEQKDSHSEHDMSAMKKGGAEAGHEREVMSTVSGGPFRSMFAMGSGTSLMPASAPRYMWHWMKDSWLIMAHGDIKAGFDHQGGPRGVNKAESQNWFMLMAERRAGPGQFVLRGMFSAEAWTAPRRGFPQLFQTGETFEGRPIIDAQHPHDLFMELAAAYNVPLTEKVSINFYGGPVGEPALGPVAFMHRISASENPSAPLGHHWQDSTHITHGVITAGITAGRFRVESSLFHGAEPDENRKDIEMGKLDSWSGRVWFTPTTDWTMQFSYGHLVNPEAATPGNLNRLTASISHNHSWKDGNWASTVIWGRNRERHGTANAYLFESTANFIDRNYVYTRMELVDKSGLLEENIFGRPGAEPSTPIENLGTSVDHFEPMFRIGAVAIGGVRDIFVEPKFRVGIGSDVTFYHVPGTLKPIYGSSPTSFHIFVRIRPGKMQH